MQSHLNKRSLLTKTGLFDIPHDNSFVAVQGVKELLKVIHRKINFLETELEQRRKNLASS